MSHKQRCARPMINPKKHALYINKAMDVFRTDGLRLSLDELADKMGISRKTLYNHFESKEALLSAFVQSMMTDMKGTLEAAFNHSSDTKANLLGAFEAVDILFNDMSPIFLYDLKRLYPQYSGNEHVMGFGFFKEALRDNLQKGVAEGVYRSDLDMEFMSDYLTFTTFAYYFNHMIMNTGVNLNGFFKNSMAFHLRALVPGEGPNH